jgi:hypothetical protein
MFWNIDELNASISVRVETCDGRLDHAPAQFWRTLDFNRRSKSG